MPFRQQLSGPAPPFPGSSTIGGGGGSQGSRWTRSSSGAGAEPWYRDVLDAQRGMHRRTPEAEFPDGYLGTIRSRRDDRLLDGLKDRQNRRPYSRGVHKGERVNPSDYFFPPEFTAESGIIRQMTTGLRQAPLLSYAEMQLVNDGKSTPRGGASLQPDMMRKTELSKLAPPWS
jgi:hypothetical protein